MGNNSKNTLNFYRKNDLGYTFCVVNYEKGHVEVPFVYNDYCNMVTLRFLKELQRFENSHINPVAANMKLLSIFTDYFALMEQFVSTIYIILYYYMTNPKTISDENISNLFREEYTKVIKNIFKILNISDMNFKRTQIFNKLAELEDSRNYILHGNTGTIKVNKTQLPKYPLTINYEDVMEELNIIINLINCFRFIFPNIDLMPSIAISINNGLAYKKLDVYFYNILIPMLNNILKKHYLEPTKSYVINTNPLPKKHSEYAKNILIYVKAIPEKEFTEKHDIKNTDIFSSLMPNIIDKKEYNAIKGKFQLPQFMLSDVHIN